jgi:hypothetical protein
LLPQYFACYRATSAVLKGDWIEQVAEGRRGDVRHQAFAQVERFRSQFRVAVERARRRAALANLGSRARSHVKSDGRSKAVRCR